MSGVNKNTSQLNISPDTFAQFPKSTEDSQLIPMQSPQRKSKSTAYSLKYSSTSSPESQQIIEIIKQLSEFRDDIDQKLRQMEEKIQKTQMQGSVVQQSPRGMQSLQIPPGYMLVSESQLQQIINDRVKVKLADYEKQINNTQQLEARVRMLEESLNNVKTLSIFGTTNRTIQDLSVQEKIEKFSKNYRK